MRVSRARQDDDFRSDRTPPAKGKGTAWEEWEKKVMESRKKEKKANG